jgi:hypothetical protein
VARKVHHEQIISMTVDEEFFYGSVDLVRGLVDQRAHLEIADTLILQYRRQGPGVASRGTQPPQPRIVILVADNY